MHDVVIVGAGPGGYAAALKARAGGKSVLLIEKAELGGVCLNEGCIPTKTLLNSAKLYACRLSADRFGVTFGEARFDLVRAMAWKNEVIAALRKGMDVMTRKHGVDVVRGEAGFLSGKSVSVGGRTYEGGDVIIATGSSPARLPVPGAPGADGGNVLSSTQILSITKLPRSLAIVGGGAIGIEFASLFSSVGVEVHVIEMCPEIAPFMEPVLASVLRGAMKDVKFHLGAKVESIGEGGVRFSREGVAENVTADAVLVCTGRRPNVEGLGLEKIGLDLGPGGIRADDRMRTNLPGVYAIGDVTGRSLFAHAATRMGEVAASTILGGSERMRFRAIPWAMYGAPEAAGCGHTEEEARRMGIDVKTATVPMRVNGRFLAEHGDAPGLCKVVVNAENGVLVGVHMVGAACSEMIFGASLMIEAELRAKDVRETVFPHPTVSEIIRDAAAAL
jgi:dihydrolipoamide dehydrogenase